MAVQAEIQPLPAGPTLAELGLTQLPAGTYAMPNRKTNKIHFFRVSYGSPRGKWTGYTFLVELHGGNEEKIRDKDLRTSIINAICRNPREAAALYGREKGECGLCGTTLTSEWRHYGIGPDCGKKNYGLTLAILRKMNKERETVQ